jgi:hypothetical protein
MKTHAFDQRLRGGFRPSAFSSELKLPPESPDNGVHPLSGNAQTFESFRQNRRLIWHR